MITKFLGILDLIVALMILGQQVLPRNVVLFAAGYLIIKGLIFVMGQDLASYVDIGVGIYLIFMAFGLTSGLLTIVSIIFLVQKGLLSLA